MLADWLLVLAGGALGAPTRYLTGVAVKSRVHSPFPFGTLAANSAACLLLGFLSEGVLRGGVTGNENLLAATGFCGALSTWSTFSYEEFTLTSTGRAVIAALYLAVAVSLGVGLSFAGAGIASTIWN
ncbi:fluoride efflux transporter FluC [Embleya sp. NPDC020630]|uniref:fluoride efflux transporter FluC n=1 Tax=Embleya sp. NPDC020630 TaxID=3363979 RepID=UPI0037ADA6DC